MLVVGPARGREAEHLDLVELVHPEDAGRVLAVGPGLASEAGGDPGVPTRQLRRVEPLAAVERGQRHLAGTNQEEVATVDFVDLAAVRGEEAGLLHRRLAHQHRRHDGSEARGNKTVRHPPHECQLEQHGLPHQRREPATTRLDRVLGLDEPERFGERRVIERGSTRLLTDHPQDNPVVLTPVGDVVVSRVGDRDGEVSYASFEQRELVLGRLELLLQCRRLRSAGVALVRCGVADLLRDRLLLRTQLLDSLPARARVLVEREHTIDRACIDTLALDAAPVRVVGAQPTQIDHSVVVTRFESARAGRRAIRPRPSTPS